MRSPTGGLRGLGVLELPPFPPFWCGIEAVSILGGRVEVPDCDNGPLSFKVGDLT